MSKVDDELTRRLQRAEQPVDSDDLFEGLERRRSRRERVRRVQAGLVAFAVLAATAGGFAILREAFNTDDREVGDSPSPGMPSAGGEIVFSKAGDDGRLHIYAAQPDGSGERQITTGSTDDSNPAVSPDGRMVAFVRTPDERTQRIAIVGIDSGAVTPLSEDSLNATDPAWSRDGAMLAYVTTGTDSRQLATFDIEQGQTRYLLDFFGQLANPTWSPDGTQIALGVVPPGSPGSVGIVPTNTMAERPLEGTLGVGSAPAWSPDGSKIALIRSGDEGDEIVTVAPDGSSETVIASWVEGPLQPDPAWAPDGTALLVSDGTWIYRVEAQPTGDPRENFVRLMEGQSPSWQRSPAGSDPSATASPEPSASPEPAGQDIGLGVAMCDLQVTSHIDWDGTGIDGAAWTGAPVDEDGHCSSSTDVQHFVAVDRDGDGVAEQATSTVGSCLLCRPFDTVDLNRDGVLELVVLKEASSTPAYALYEVSQGERSPGVYPIFVQAPGAPSMNLDANEPARFIVGGDEGFSGSLRCEDDGAGPPIIRYIWVNGAVDADTELNVDVVRLQLANDGVFHIRSIDGFSIPRDSEPPGLTSTQPACGVDFHPAA